MAIIQNPNSLLFLYEGETEEEFYKKLFNTQIPPRSIRRNYGNLQGVYSLNQKVKSKINAYLSNDAHKNCHQIHVFIAYDREGPRETESLLDVGSLADEFIGNKKRIKSITEIVATQDLESWFFHDIEGIYQHLKVPQAQRNYVTYKNVEATNNRVLSYLFHRHNKHYQKGKRAHGFIDNLDLDKILNNVQELKDSISHIKELCKHKS